MKHRIVVFLLISLIISLRPIDDYDIFMQVALGEHSLTNYTILAEEPFLISVNMLNWANPGWLWQIGASLIVRSGGFQLLKISHILLFALAIIFCLLPKPQKCQENKTVEALCLTILPILSSTSLRPQILAFLFFSFCYYLLRSKKNSLYRNLLLLSCFVIWQNIHPSVLAAVPLILFCGEKKFSLKNFFYNRLPLLLGCSISVLATPMGLSVLSVSKYNQSVSRNIFKITEWFGYLELPYSFLPAFGICLLISSGIVFSAFRRKTISAEETILFIIYSLSVLFAVRLVVFWSLVSLPILVKAFSRMDNRRLPSDVWNEVSLGKIKYYSIFIISLVLLYAQTFIPYYSKDLPFQCVTPLLKEKGNLRIFNDYRWGGIIANILGSKVKIVADGRLYQRDTDWWKNYLTFYDESLGTIEKLFDPNVILLSGKTAANLITTIENHPNWDAVYQEKGGTQCHLFIKK